MARWYRGIGYGTKYMQCKIEEGIATVFNSIKKFLIYLKHFTTKVPLDRLKFKYP